MRKNPKTNERIFFRILSEYQCEEVDAAVLHVLKEIGAIVDDVEICSLLKRAGATINNKRVYIPETLVKKALSCVPSGFSLYNRYGTKKIHIEGDNTYFGPGPSNTYTIDPYTEERRHPVKNDTINAVRVMDALENIDFVMDFGTIRDVPAPYADVHLLQAILENTTKPICHWGYNAKNLQTMLHLCTSITGDTQELIRRPFFSLFTTSNTPLFHSREALEILSFMAKKSLPFFYVSAPMAGTTAPITQAGTLVLCLAECLTGLVIHQLLNEGAPFAIGGVPVASDMHSLTMSYGSPEFNVMHAGLAEMAHYYRLPMWGTAGCTDSKHVDQQAAIEATASIIMSSMSGANFIHDIGYIEGGSTSSLAQLVMCDEIIGHVKKMKEGIEINEKTLALEAMKEVGPKGQFVSHQHTLENFKSLWSPSLMDRRNYQKWLESGEISLGERALKRARKLIKEYRGEPLPEKVKKRMEEIIRVQCQ